jgi:hypothetical protein
MGHGIAQVAAQAGFEVLLADAAADALTRGQGKISESLEKLVAKGRMEAGEAEAAGRRVRGTTDLSDLGSAELVVEAVVERLEVKAEVLAELDRVCAADTVLATNTSSISITRLAAETARPDRVIGMHFMNPVPLMKLVEIIRGLGTSQADDEGGQDVSQEPEVDVQAEAGESRVIEADFGHDAQCPHRTPGVGARGLSSRPQPSCERFVSDYGPAQDDQLDQDCPEDALEDTWAWSVLAIFGVEVVQGYAADAAEVSQRLNRADVGRGGPQVGANVAAGRPAGPPGEVGQKRVERPHCPFDAELVRPA